MKIINPSAAILCGLAMSAGALSAGDKWDIKKVDVRTFDRCSKPPAFVATVMKKRKGICDSIAWKRCSKAERTVRWSLLVTASKAYWSPLPPRSTTKLPCRPDVVPVDRAARAIVQGGLVVPVAAIRLPLGREGRADREVLADRADLRLSP